MKNKRKLGSIIFQPSVFQEFGIVLFLAQAHCASQNIRPDPHPAGGGRMVVGGGLTAAPPFLREIAGGTPQW